MTRRATTAAAATAAALALLLGSAGGARADGTQSGSSADATTETTTTDPGPTPTTGASSPSSSRSSSSSSSSSSSTSRPPGSGSSSHSSSHSSPSSSAPSGTSSTATGASGGTGEEGLSGAALAAQVAAAQSLRTELAGVNKRLADVVAQLDALSGRANAALEAYADATQAQAQAATEAKRQQDLSDLYAIEVASERQRLRAWAYYAYTEGGGSVAEVMGVIDSMKDSPADVGNPVGDLTYLTDTRAQAFATLNALSQQQQLATQRARAASAKATAEAAAAKKAKTAADQLVAAQQQKLADLRATHAKDLAKAGPLVAVLAGVLTPEARTAYRSLLAEMKKSGTSIQDVGTPCSDNDATYPNGRLPASALCPLWKAPGMSLRPKAAAAFNAMSAAYAKDTGSPLCVTSSYRSYADQVSVKASRGRWAATPGTSQHGLGLAVDLCGGVNSFGTAAFEWMKQNGPTYGWYHPAWAEPTGSLPEPWHWQFAD